ncbi:MAG: tryptophan synthase subunit alpha [Clostridia bacterium]|nr:tryptophan synthase subunit alpha [Clostridia bacterium]
MSRIRKAFEGGKAFIPFVTCGDPDLETTERIVKSMAAAGADVIELGIPFSDPVAEGPVIQAANVRALSGGVTTDKILDMTARIRGDIDVPLVFMTYANVLFSYGTERFLKRARDAGIGGVILPDVPFEEKAEFAPLCRKYGIDFISLVAPTSKERIEMIAREAESFLYCVSSLGVTGERSRITSNISEMTALAKKVSDIPAAVGFGISTPAQAREMAALSDGVIVGSAIVRLIGEYGRDSEKHVYEYVKSMKEAIKNI